MPSDRFIIRRCYKMKSVFLNLFRTELNPSQFDDLWNWILKYNGLVSFSFGSSTGFVYKFVTCRVLSWSFFWGIKCAHVSISFWVYISYCLSLTSSLSLSLRSCKLQIRNIPPHMQWEVSAHFAGNVKLFHQKPDEFTVGRFQDLRTRWSSICLRLCYTIWLMKGLPLIIMGMFCS